MTESMMLPDDLVGLIIGRGGENIMRMQRETGCRIQITQSIPGTKDRPCTLSGTAEQIEVCRNMLNEIVSRSQTGTLGNSFNMNAGGMGDGLEKQIEIAIPADKCGLIIGKGGETIKMLQQSLGVKMLLIQDSTENVGHSKPLRITGMQANLDGAVNAIHQMMAQRDQQLAEQKMDTGMFGDNGQIMPVPKAAVGVVIGKGGEMINQIQNMTATRIQFKPEDSNLPDRICTITGSKEGIDSAVRRIQELISNVQERDAGNRMGGVQGGMGSFGEWEAPNMGRGRQMGMNSEEHLVPANKTGLVIGKGGDTIKQINMQSGAHCEIQRNPPPGSDLSYKTFVIKGTPEQIKTARQLIQEKVDARGGSAGGMAGGPLSGPPSNGPPIGNFALPQQQNSFGGAPPVGVHPQNPMQGTPQTQQPQSFQQQPWGNQFQQWTPPAATTPQQNGKPVPDVNNAAAWQTYMQLYGGGQPAGFQAPSVAPAAAAATAAPTVSGAAAVPDYSKQWDEYLKQTGALAAAGPQVGAPGTVQAQQVAVANPTPTAAAQPSTTQTDYSAAWAEYYRHFYQLQGQQYAAVAAAGQAPAQN